MDRERGSFELRDVRHRPGSAGGITEWKGDIFLEDEQSAHDYMRHCAVRSPQGVERSFSVYDVVRGMLVFLEFLFRFLQSPLSDVGGEIQMLRVERRSL